MSRVHEITTNKYGFHTKWELNEETLRQKHSLKTEEYFVDEMENVKWHLTWISKDENFCLYLNIESEKEVSYTTYLHYFLIPSHFENFCEAYIKDEVVTINFHGFFCYTPEINIFNNPIISNANEWGSKFKHNSSTDFSINVDDQIIHIHKLLVSVESSVFTKMFEGNFKEAQEKKVTITDFKYEIVQAAIDYCYAQNISSILDDQDKTIDLLYFADKYDFSTLKPKLEKFLSQKICKENVSIFASISEKANSLQLRKACLNFIHDLFNKKEGFPAEEVAKLDAQFLIDLVTLALN
uniref:BTB domain-containing protein n=1 Tax=Panagrolaimus sp. PS1159 TaxID=55785 RepID=A0AC35FN80_9BILA